MKHFGNIDQLWKDAHFDMDPIFGFIDAGSIAHGPELRKNLELFKNSEFEKPPCALFSRPPQRSGKNKEQHNHASEHSLLFLSHVFRPSLPPPMNSTATRGSQHQGPPQEAPTPQPPPRGSTTAWARTTVHPSRSTEFAAVWCSWLHVGGECSLRGGHWCCSCGTLESGSRASGSSTSLMTFFDAWMDDNTIWHEFGSQHHYRSLSRVDEKTTAHSEWMGSTELSRRKKVPFVL